MNFRLISLVLFLSMTMGCNIPQLISESHNRDILSQLELGMSRNDVEHIMGSPYITESHSRDNGAKVLILRYSTGYRGGSRSEKNLGNTTTPVVFVDNRVIGWGNAALLLAE